MAYNTDDLFAKAKKLIKTKKLLFINEVYGLLAISASTFYEHFPKESDTYKVISSMLQTNKVNIKSHLRERWYREPNNPKGQEMLYKLSSTAEERKMLSNHVDLTTDGDKIEINYLEKLTTEEIMEIREKIYGKTNSDKRAI